MTFDEILDQVRELLRERHRVSYAALKRRFELSEEVLEDLKVELIEAEQVAADENGRILVWSGSVVAAVPPSQPPESAEPAPNRTTSSLSRSAEPQQAAGERRQLTVQFIDLVGSRASPNSLTPKTIMPGWWPIRRLVSRPLRATRGISRNIWVMACWCTLAIRWRMKTMRCGLCAADWKS